MIYQEMEKQIETCGMCNNEIELNSNPTGLVINNEHFICTNCCITADKQELIRFTKEKSQGSNSVRPIIRWLWEKTQK